MIWGLWVESEACPICGQFDSDCNATEKEVFCANTPDFATFPGFEYRGRTKLGHGRFEYRGYTPAPRPQRPDATPQHYAEPEHWDLFYRGLPDELGATHRKDLTARLKRAGLDPETHLPNLGAKTVAGGYVIPAVSPDGLQIGAQICNDNRESGAKYLWWPFSDSPSWPFDPTIANTRHILFNGNAELPITFWSPLGEAAKPKTLAFVEGLGIKPYIAAQVLGCPVVGASSGNHQGSPEQVKAIVERFGIEAIVIVPDAGDPINPHVLHRLKGQIAFAGSMGLPVSVLWWGQVDKSKPDIDDGVSPKSIKNLQVEQYMSMTEAYSDQMVSAPEPEAQKTPKGEKFRYESREAEAEAISAKIESVLVSADPVARALIKREIAETHRIGPKELEAILTATISRQVATEAIKGSILDLLNQKQEPVRYAIPGLLAEREGTMICGDSGVGKSNLAIAIANGLVRGTDVFGIPVARPYRIGFAGTDQSFESLKLSASLSGLIETIQKPFYMESAQQSGFPWVSYYDRVSVTQVHAFEQWLIESRPDFVILDSTNTWIGEDNAIYDMNGTAFAAALANWVEVARRHDCGLIVLHHANKRDLKEGQTELSKVSGNSRIQAPFMSIIYLGLDSGGKTRVLKHIKHRGGPCLPPILLNYRYKLDWDNGIFDVLNAETIAGFFNTQRKIISCWAGREPGVGLEQSEIFNGVGWATDEQKHQIHLAIDDLLVIGALVVRKSQVSNAKVLVLDLEAVPEYLRSIVQPPPPPPAPAPITLHDRNGAAIEIGSPVRFEGVEGDAWSQFLGRTFTVSGFTDGQVNLAEIPNWACHSQILVVVTTAPAPVAPRSPAPVAPASPATEDHGRDADFPVGQTVRWTITDCTPEQIAEEVAERGVADGSLGVVVSLSRDGDGDLWVDVNFEGNNVQSILYTDLTPYGQKTETKQQHSGRGFGNRVSG